MDHFTYLGVTLDNRLNFLQHYTNVTNKLKQKIYLVCSIRHLIDKKTALILYKSHLLSFLEYGSIFIEGLSSQCKVKLQRPQNRCLRISLRSNRYTSNFDLHKSSNLLPLRCRRQMAMCQIMYRKIKRNPSILIVPTRSGNRSEATNIARISWPKKERFKKCLAYTLPYVWNTLPVYLRKCNNIENFKKYMKIYMYNCYCQDVYS